LFFWAERAELKENRNVHTVMHKTLHPSVLGYLDTKSSDRLVQGWVFLTSGELPFIQCAIGSKLIVPTFSERPDVVAFYRDRLPVEIKPLGWYFERAVGEGYQLQVEVDGKWETVFEEKPLQLNSSVTSALPSFIVVDNFYTDPDSVRAFALQQPLIAHPNNHKGIRSDNVYRFPGLKERFEQLIGVKVDTWERYGTNGCFQINIAGDQAVYHADTQMYAGVLFLTPNAPAAAGTKLFRSLPSGVRKPDAITHDEVFRGGFYDSTKFEEIDVAGNVYNRLILFDARLIHAADTYFGTTRENGRLIQLFFFDLQV
jgi:hypothetical protein